MQPAFGRQHRLQQKWSESMYLLDKKIYLKFHQIEKILSGPNRGSKFRSRCVKKVSNLLPRQTIKRCQTCFHPWNLALCDCICMVKWWSTPKVSCNSGVVCLIDCLLRRTLFCQNPGFGTLRFWTLIYFLELWFFKYIFLSSRYIDSDHYCCNPCCRPKPGSIPTA